MDIFFSYSSFSTQGIRPNNQDRILVEKIDIDSDLISFIALADGMGGMAAGHVASSIAIKRLKEIIYQDITSTDSLILTDVRKFIKLLFLEINNSILEDVSLNPNNEGMGTTLTVGFLFSNNEVYIANIGDSRAYLVYSDEIIQITVDHDVITDAKLKGIDTNENINLEMYSNALTRSLGTEDYLDVDIFGPFLLNPGESLLLSSDGFHKFIHENDVLHIFNNFEKDNYLAEKLVNKASLNGSDDNISVISLNYLSEPPIKNSMISKKINIRTYIILILLLFSTSYISYLVVEEYKLQNGSSSKFSSSSPTLNVSEDIHSPSTDIDSIKENNLTQTKLSVDSTLNLIKYKIENENPLALTINLDNNSFSLVADSIEFITKEVSIINNFDRVKADLGSLYVTESKSRIIVVTDSVLNDIDDACHIVQISFLEGNKIKSDSSYIILADQSCNLSFESNILIIFNNIYFKNISDLFKKSPFVSVRINFGE